MYWPPILWLQAGRILHQGYIPKKKVTQIKIMQTEHKIPI